MPDLFLNLTANLDKLIFNAVGFILLFSSKQPPPPVTPTLANAAHSKGEIITLFDLELF